MLAALLVIGIVFPASTFAQPERTRLVSINGGCLAVPHDAKVIMTETSPDAWLGYVQLPGEVRRVSWATGLVATRLSTSSNFATTKTESGDELKYAGFTHSGKRGYVARIGTVEFSLVGDTTADLEYLLSVAGRLRIAVPRDQCERPEFQLGKSAF
jgi:hypothetical protein